MEKIVLDWAEENMRKLIKTLPEKEAKVITMRYFEKLTYPEIIQRLSLDKIRLNKREVQNIVKALNDRILDKEGMFRTILKFYNDYLELCVEYKKVKYRERRKQKKQANLRRREG